jgi:hypothetical protein
MVAVTSPEQRCTNSGKERLEQGGVVNPGIELVTLDDRGVDGHRFTGNYNNYYVNIVVRRS